MDCVWMLMCRLLACQKPGFFFYHLIESRVLHTVDNTGQRKTRQEKRIKCSFWTPFSMVLINPFIERTKSTIYIPTARAANKSFCRSSLLDSIPAPMEISGSRAAKCCTAWCLLSRSFYADNSWVLLLLLEKLEPADNTGDLFQQSCFFKHPAAASLSLLCVHLLPTISVCRPALGKPLPAVADDDESEVGVRRHEPSC